MGLGLGLELGLELEGQKARSDGSTRCAKAARHSTRPEPKVPARGDEAAPPARPDEALVAAS